MSQRKKLCILGNCVAHRIQEAFLSTPEITGRYSVQPLPMIHQVKACEGEKGLQRLSEKVLSCDVILTQPLFNFSWCNTTRLRQEKRPSQTLLTFSAPDFDAYFPDICWLKAKENLRSQPVFDWDSRIFLACYLNNIPVFEVERIYLAHPMFDTSALRRHALLSLERYAKREENVDIPTLPYLLQRYKRERLFYSSMHPTNAFLAFMYASILDALGTSAAAAGVPVIESFGFNRWPVILRDQALFSFKSQEYFLVGNERHTIEDVAMAAYIFYEKHPHIVQVNRQLAQGIL